MTDKLAILRRVADHDVDAAINHNRTQANVDVALDFAAELDETYDCIAQHSMVGSPRYAHELDIERLRHRRLKRSPYLIFYRERADHIDVWRVLHEASNTERD